MHSHCCVNIAGWRWTSHCWEQELPFTHREPGGQHKVPPLQVAALEQHEDMPPSINGRQLKPSLAQHSPLQHLTVVLQQKPPQQRCVEEEAGVGAGAGRHGCQGCDQD